MVVVLRMGRRGGVVKYSFRCGVSLVLSGRVGEGGREGGVKYLRAAIEAAMQSSHEGRARSEGWQCCGRCRCWSVG